MLLGVVPSIYLINYNKSFRMDGEYLMLVSSDLDIRFKEDKFMVLFDFDVF